jgi:hypothetical protein
MGTAYLLRNDQYQTKVVERLNYLKKDAQLPSNLEVTVAETAKIDGLPDEQRALALDCGLVFALKGTHPTMPNPDVASQLGDLGISIGNAFYEKGDPYIAQVVYERNGRWLVHE